MSSDAKKTPPVRIREKLSMGIACCRYDNGRPEILLVKRRVTYSFITFVKGGYNANNNNTILKLLQRMTVDEKLDIMRRDFAAIWYRTWPNRLDNVPQEYYSAKLKFDTLCVADDGNRLKKLVDASHTSPNPEKLWGIPKGRKANKNESQLQCACREFLEETSIPKKQFTIIPGASKTQSYIDDGVRYTNKYYFAFAHKDIEPRITLTTGDQINEICEIEWMCIDKIRFVCPNMAAFARSILRYIKKYKKGIPPTIRSSK